MKHGEDIQFVPDRKNGDGGLEGFRLDDGIVYQCYAPEDALSIEDQTNSQKKKIRTDIHKLVSNSDETIKLLGTGYLIRRWVLLTPEYDDKELVKYARYKGDKTRESMPRPRWCHDDFQVLITTDRELFPAQLAAWPSGLATQIRLQVAEPAEDELIRAVDAGLSGRVEEKMRMNPLLAADGAWLAEACSDTLWEYVYGKSQLQALQDRYGLAYEAVSRRARMICRSLTRGTSAVADPEALVRQLSDGFAADIPELARIACDELARHYVATWWVECPLRYRAAA
jgi:hypothetical protein